MVRQFKKLDEAKIAELEKSQKRRLSEEELHSIGGGINGYGITTCPLCGSDDVYEEEYFIEAGPDAGRIELYVGCHACGYREFWGDI